MATSSTPGPIRDGNGPPTKKAKVTLEKGTVSQAIAMDIVKVLLTSSDDGDQLFGLQTLTRQIKTRGGDLYGKLAEPEVMTQLVRLLAGNKSRAQMMASCALVDICGTSRKSCAKTNENYESCLCEWCDASRANCAAVINAGAVPELVKLLESTKNPMVAENCLGCLFNITDDFNNRDVILQQGIIPLLMKRTEDCLNINRRKSSGSSKGTRTSNDKIACQIVRLYGNLCRSENDVDIDMSTIRDFLPVLSRVLRDFQDHETLVEGCRAIIHLTHNNANSELEAAESGVCTGLVELMLHPDPKVAKSALSATVSISDGNMVCKKEVLKCGVLPNIVQLLNNSPDENVLKNIYMLIANVCNSGCDNSKALDEIQQIIDAGLFPGLVQAAKEGTAKVMFEASRALNNVASEDGGSVEQVEYLVEQGALEALYHQIPLLSDEKILVAKLDALECILDRVTDFSSSTTNAGTRMVNAGAVPQLIKLLTTTKDPKVAYDCISCLNSITWDIQNPDVVLQKGIIALLVRWAEHCLEVNQRESTKPIGEKEHTASELNDFLAYQILQFHHNLCELSKDPVNMALLNFLPVLARVLSEFRDPDVLDTACDIINGLAYGNEKLQLAVSKSGVCSGLVQLIMHPDPTVAESALVAIINISDNSLICKEELLKCEVLPKVVECLNGSPDQHSLSNIYKLIQNFAKTPDHIQKIIDAQLIPGMIEATKGDQAKVRLQATKAICTMTENGKGTAEQVDYLVEQGILEALCCHLSLSTEENTLMESLDGLSFILERVQDQTDKLSRLQKRIEKCGGLTQIEILQTHKNLDVYQKAYDLADNYFDCQLRKLKVRATYIDIED